jgi:hypothetical protein
MLHNVLFFVMLFVIRDVDDKFSIASELRKVCIISTFCLTFYTFSDLFLDTTLFVIMGWSQYLLAVMSLSLLYFTAWTPISETYKQSEIIPFSLNLECLTNVESAMIQEIPSKFFYDYIVYDLNEFKGITLYAVYADLRRFMALCD